MPEINFDTIQPSPSGGLPPGWEDEKTKAPFTEVTPPFSGEEKLPENLPEEQAQTLEAQNYGRGIPADWGESPQQQMTQIKETLSNYSKDPEEDFEKVLSSHHIAAMIGRDPAEVFLNYDQSVKDYFGETLVPKRAMAAIKDEGVRATKTVILGHYGTALLMNPIDEELQNKITDIIGSMPPMDNAERWLGMDAMKAAANVVPSIGASMVAGWMAGTASSMAFGPEAFPIGFSIGSGAEAFAISAGNIYVDMINTIDPASNKPLIEVVDDPVQFMNMARAASVGGGLLSAAVEVVQLDALSGGRALQGLINRKSTHLLREFLVEGNMRKLFQEFLIQHGKNVGENVMEELAQESIEMVAKRIVLDVESELSDLDIPLDTWETWRDAMKETAKQTALGIGVIGLPGTISGMSSGFKQLQAKNYEMVGPGAEYFQVDEMTKSSIVEHIKSTGLASEADIEKAMAQLKGAKSALSGKLPAVDVIDSGGGEYVPTRESAAMTEALKRMDIKTAAINVVKPEMADIQTAEQNIETAKLTRGQFQAFINSAARATSSAVHIKPVVLPEGSNPKTESALTGSLIYSDVSELGVAAISIKKEMPVFDVKTDSGSGTVTMRAQMPNGYISNLVLKTEETWIKEEKINPVLEKAVSDLEEGGFKEEAEFLKESISSNNQSIYDVFDSLSAATETIRMSKEFERGGNQDKYNKALEVLNQATRDTGKDYSGSIASMQPRSESAGQNIEKPLSHRQDYEYSFDEWANLKKKESETELASTEAQDQVNKDVLREAFKSFP